MRHLIRLAILCAVVLALSLFAVPSSAQGDDLVVVGYAVGGKQVVVAHPRQRERFSGDPEVLRTALTRAEAVYERLFGPTRMKIFAEFVTTRHPEDAEAFAAAGKDTVDVPVVGSNRSNRETVCHITVFNIPANQVAGTLAITIVHELVHCYQGFHIREDPPRLALPARAWWIEGTAEWLAQKVYPEFDVAPEVSAWQADFVANVGKTLLSGDYSYDAMYFWHALERHTNVTRAMELLKQLLREPDNAAAILDRLPDSKGVFATFGKLMGHNAIPYQPASDRLYKPERVYTADALPFRFAVYSDAFSFTPYFVNLTAETRGVVVRVTGQTAGDYTVYSPYTLEEIPEGGTFSLCNATGFPLIVSRGKSREGVEPPLVELIGYDCTSESAPPPSCLVGRWKLASWPSITRPSDGEVLTYGASGIDILPTGNFTFRLDGLKIQIGAPEGRKVQLRLNGVVYAGRAAFADLGRGRYKPASGTAQLIGTPTAWMQISGVPGIQEIGESLRRFLPASGALGGSNVVFICTGANTMEYQITASGQTIIYRFTK
ncbi:MAG: hypothetical protein RML95_06080 [Anaerolineae bacterium]|nr:hypothetical protein [Anaerolineae bacterium]MDW8298887.1 hypothetical protein [Anaerolineae bacterium]